MKLFKILFVTIGALLAAIIIIPLTVLAGLFVWLKLTEEGDDDDELARNEGARQRPPARSRGECGEGDRRSAHVRRTAGASRP